jgi:RND family efflux transporter MFP subunit
VSTFTLLLVVVLNQKNKYPIMSEESEFEHDVALPEAGATRKMARWLVILLVLAIGVGGFIVLKNTGPKADKEEPPRVVPVVRVITVRADEKQMYVQTQGRVEPFRTTQAASEVMGRVKDVSKKFKSGGVFKHKEIMLEIDSADYVSALANAEASHADAKLLLQQEEARAEQARRDWSKLGRGEPSNLVLRKPQIESAKARVAATLAAVEKATRDLDRTKLRAPYDCRVEAVYTDLGSYITPGARLADLYSVDQLEVRMPVTMEELGYLKQDEAGTTGADVTIVAELAGEAREWKGEIIRSEGRVDRNTMTTHLVMQIAPSKYDKLFSLPPTGLVVRAKITGKVIGNVTEIPRRALREDNTVLTLTAENKLKILSVKLARTMEKTVLISSGLPDGARLIISPIEMPVNGMELAIQEEQNPENNQTP